MEESKLKLLYTETVSSLVLCSSHPLFSCGVTFCTLVLLYFPHLFRKIVLSPILILTAILLVAILRLGATQRSQNEQKEKNLGISEPREENRGSKEQKEMNSNERKETNSVEQVHQCFNDSEMVFDSISWFEESFMERNVKTPLEIIYEEENRGSKKTEEANFPEQIHPSVFHVSERNFGSNSCFKESFTEWNVKAPLEVIYEEYEGQDEEEEEAEDSNEKVGTRFVGISGYPLLSRYEPESDSDRSSDGEFPPMGNWDSPENICLEWEEEDREGLIEIALEGCCKMRGLELQFEEDNLIEIDISPTRYRDFSGENQLFSGEIICS